MGHCSNKTESSGLYYRDGSVWNTDTDVDIQNTIYGMGPCLGGMAPWSPLGSATDEHARTASAVVTDWSSPAVIEVWCLVSSTYFDRHTCWQHQSSNEKMKNNEVPSSRWGYGGKSHYVVGLRSLSIWRRDLATAGCSQCSETCSWKIHSRIREIQNFKTILGLQGRLKVIQTTSDTTWRGR